MKSDNLSFLYTVIGSVIIGIVFIFLYITGYFANAVNALYFSLYISLGIIVYLSFAGLFADIPEDVIKHTVVPLTTGSFASAASAVLSLSASLIPGSKSTILLLFVSGVLFTFSVCYFYKLIIWFFRSNRNCMKNSISEK